MRLVSQDGTVDVPYDISAISLGEYGAKHIIYVRSKFLDDKPCAFAYYSTKEKALKAINMLKCAYTGVVIMQNVEQTKEALERLKSVNVVLTSIDNQPSNIEYMNNAIFQFPKDEEIEV
jgi:hypothetical protein